MSTAATLEEASYLSYSQMSLFFSAATLVTATNNFTTDASPIFQDAVTNDRPVGNWLILIQGLVAQFNVVFGPNEAQFNELVEFVARMCIAAFTMHQQQLITDAQRTALLAAWNSAYGT